MTHEAHTPPNLLFNLHTRHTHHGHLALQRIVIDMCVEPRHCDPVLAALGRGELVGQDHAVYDATIGQCVCGTKVRPRKKSLPSARSFVGRCRKTLLGCHDLNWSAKVQLCKKYPSGCKEQCVTIIWSPYARRPFSVLMISAMIGNDAAALLNQSRHQHSVAHHSILFQ
eukprot:1157700-Pelagomonas_calceolata.AAC.2